LGRKNKQHKDQKTPYKNKRRAGSDDNLFDWIAAHKKILLLLSLILYISLGTVHFSSGLSTTGDNAEFVVLAQSLAQGDGYKTINNPHPHAHKKYPFGFPALLALFYHLFYLNYIGYKIVVFLLSIATLFLLSKWLDDCKPYLLISILLLMALNLKILEYSSLILSETPFLLFVVLGFLFFKQFDKSAKTSHFLYGLISWGTAYYIRSIGIVLLLSLIIYLLIKREYKWMYITFFASILIIMPWQVWTNMHGGSSYLNSLQMKNPYSPQLGKVTISDIIFERVPLNFKGYFFTFIPETLIPGFKYHKTDTMDFVGALLSLSVLGGFILNFWKKWDLKGWYFLGTLSLVLLWPEVWMGERFIFGIIPLILFYFVVFFDNIIKRVTKLQKRQARLFTGCIAIFLVLLTSKQIKYSNPQTQYTPDWVNYKYTLFWLKHNVPSDAVIACRKPYLAYLWSGKKTVGIPRTSNKKNVYQRFFSDGVDYLIYDGFFWTSTTRRNMSPVINKNRTDFQAVYGLKKPSTYILKFNATNLDKEEKNK